MMVGREKYNVTCFFFETVFTLIVRLKHDTSIWDLPPHPDLYEDIIDKEKLCIFTKHRVMF